MPGPGALRQLARSLHDAAEVFFCLPAIQLAISIKFKLRESEDETSLPQRCKVRRLPSATLEPYHQSPTGNEGFATTLHEVGEALRLVSVVVAFRLAL